MAPVDFGGPVVGRDRELAQIGRFLDGRREGSKTLVLSGEIGIGKSILMQHACQMVGDRGYRLLAATPVEAELPLEFAALADLLEGVPAPVIAALPEPQRHAVEAAVLRRETVHLPVDPRTIATAVLGVVRQLATDRPVVIVVDDVPSLDAASARVLAFVMRRARSAAIGLVAAARTDWLLDPRWTAVADLDIDQVEQLPLGPISLGALRTLLSTRVEFDTNRTALVRLHRGSGGNPWLAMHMATDANVGNPEASTSLPPALDHLVSSLLARLSPGERDMLLVAALSSTPTPPTVRAAAAAPATAGADLDSLVRLRFLRQAGGRLRFTHPLLRSVITERSGLSARRAVHQRLAVVVDLAEERLRHLAQGAGGPDTAAANAAEEAAVIAAARGACDEAADLAELACALTPDDQVGERHRRTLLQAACRFAASDPTAACSLLEGALGDALGPPRAEILRNLARYRGYLGATLEAWAEMLESALDAAGGNDLLRAAILGDLAFAAANAGDVGRSAAYGISALECAGRVGDHLLEAQLGAGEAVVRFLRGEGVSGDLVARALEAPTPPAQVSMELRPGLAVAHILRWSDDLDRSRRLYKQEYATAKAYGIETGLPILLWGLADLETSAGNLDEAESLVDEGYALADEAGSAPGLAFMLGARARVQAYRGQPEDARANAERSIDLMRGQGLSLHLMTAAYQAFGLAGLLVGDALGAHRFLASAVESASSTGVAEPGVVPFVTDDVEALIRIGELGAAATVLDAFQHRAVQLGRGSAIAAAGRCRGLLLAASGDLAAAEATLDAALNVYQTIPFPFEHARTLSVAGEIHRRARHRSPARARFEESMHTFEDVGAYGWADRVRPEVDRLGIRRRTAGDQSRLTATEQRVAGLAATGLTNSQIAARLFMAQRTVESHLARIYRKLGVTNRTEMAGADLRADPPTAS